MRITSKQLLGLQVVTVSGQKLGRVQQIELDTATHQVTCYEVKIHFSLSDLIPDTLLISPQQVVAITAEQVVVEDATYQSSVRQYKKDNRPIKEARPVMMSKRNSNS